MKVFIAFCLLGLIAVTRCQETTTAANDEDLSTIDSNNERGAVIITDAAVTTTDAAVATTDATNGKVTITTTTLSTKKLHSRPFYIKRHYGRHSFSSGKVKTTKTRPAQKPNSRGRKGNGNGSRRNGKSGNRGGGRGSGRGGSRGGGRGGGHGARRGRGGGRGRNNNSKRGKGVSVNRKGDYNLKVAGKSNK